MSGAYSLFTQFIKGGKEFLNKVVEDSWIEDFLLDFKTLEHHSAPMTKSDMQNFAEALSGFANSDGGVIVWGIDARVINSNSPDVAQKLCPISYLKRFCSDLQRYTPQLVAPSIVGVEHYPIYESDSSDTGFVISFIPKSEVDIHMAQAKDQHRFYYRSGNSFRHMEAFMVADRFGRRPQPKLDLEYRFEQGGSSGRNIEVRLVIGIKNCGQGIALYPAIAIYESARVKLDPHGLDGNGHPGLPERIRTSSRPDDARRLFAGGVNDAIHPGTTLEVTCISIKKIPIEANDYPDVDIKYDLYCQGYSTSGQNLIFIMGFLKTLR